MKTQVNRQRVASHSSRVRYIFSSLGRVPPLRASRSRIRRLGTTFIAALSNALGTVVLSNPFFTGSVSFKSFSRWPSTTICLSACVWSSWLHFALCSSVLELGPKVRPLVMLVTL